MELAFISALVAFSFLAAMRTSIQKYRKIIPPPSFVEFSIANREATLSQVILSVLATTLGGAIAIGFIGLVYRSGTAFYIAGLSFLIGLIMLYAMVSSIRRQVSEGSITSFEQYIAGGNSWLMALVGIVNIFAFIGLLVSQIISLKLILLLRFPQYSEWLFPTIIVLVIIYTALYGLMGVMENDKVQLSAILLWVLAIIFALGSDLDGVASIASLPPEMLNGLAMGIPFIAVVIIFLPWTALARADFWQRIVAAESDDNAKSALGVLIVTMFFMYSLFALTGLYLIATNPGLDFNSAPFEILEALPDGLVTFAVVGIVAALISSADSFLNISAISIMSLFRGVSQALGDDRQSTNPSGDDDLQQGKTYRLFALAVGCTAYLLVMLYDNLGVWVIMATSAVGLIVPSFIGNMIRPDGGKIPNITSIAVGIVIYAIALVSDRIKPDEAFVFAILGATATYLIVLYVFGKMLVKEKI
ncbi:MAG: hypothetical protein JBO36_04890 [Candidatus Thiodiazotropha taylori]|nr:hypothetical protein [Candidatus Thiodiazotropha taylori]